MITVWEYIKNFNNICKDKENLDSFKELHNQIFVEKITEILLNNSNKIQLYKNETNVFLPKDLILDNDALYKMHSEINETIINEIIEVQEHNYLLLESLLAKLIAQKSSDEFTFFMNIINYFELLGNEKIDFIIKKSDTYKIENKLNENSYFWIFLKLFKKHKKVDIAVFETCKQIWINISDYQVSLNPIIAQACFEYDNFIQLLLEWENESYN